MRRAAVVLGVAIGLLASGITAATHAEDCRTFPADSIQALRCDLANLHAEMTLQQVLVIEGLDTARDDDYELLCRMANFQRVKLVTNDSGHVLWAVCTRE